MSQYGGYLPAGAADDSRAPWNEKDEAPEREDVVQEPEEPEICEVCKLPIAFCIH